MTSKFFKLQYAKTFSPAYVIVLLLCFKNVIIFSANSRLILTLVC